MTGTVLLYRRWDEICQPWLSKLPVIGRSGVTRHGARQLQTSSKGLAVAWIPCAQDLAWGCAAKWEGHQNVHCLLACITNLAPSKDDSAMDSMPA